MFSALPPTTDGSSLAAAELSLTAAALVGDPLCCGSGAVASAPPPGAPSDQSRRAATVVLARRGECTFVQKAWTAQASGAVGIVVVGDGEELMVMGGAGENATEEQHEQEASLGIFVVYVQKDLGEKLLAWNEQQTPGWEAVRLSVTPYEPSTSLWDLSLALELLGATALVAAGAFFATADLRPGSTLAPNADEVLEIDSTMAMSFCIVGSVALMTLFFFMRYAIYVIMFSFCAGGASSVTQICSACLQYLFPSLRRRVCTVPEVGPVVTADLISLVLAVSLVLGWIQFRHTSIGWIFQDIIGAGFLCMLQRTMRLPNIKVATLLLSSMFFFDIFWVFLSPLLFRKSVMIEVAKGAGTGETVPMLLRIPQAGDPFGAERMLGFGDIALPGLLVSHLLRYDKLSKQRWWTGYFATSIVGYFFGLAATIVVLMWTHAGQPALLYLVPGTLGSTLCRSWCRGEWSKLWHGLPESDAGAVKAAVDDPETSVIAAESPNADYRQRRTQPEELQRLTRIAPDALGRAEAAGSDGEGGGV
mmetsp:Transcript_75232/g.243544  ORF Transcript_75232/g.243544 Transcript_75232/m.243544 type:complete len:533 (+) Transcript_75232:3-1601(+)